MANVHFLSEPRLSDIVALLCVDVQQIAHLGFFSQIFFSVLAIGDAAERCPPDISGGTATFPSFPSVFGKQRKTSKFGNYTEIKEEEGLRRGIN